MLIVSLCCIWWFYDKAWNDQVVKMDIGGGGGGCGLAGLRLSAISAAVFALVFSSAAGAWLGNSRARARATEKERRQTVQALRQSEIQYPLGGQ